MVPKTSSINRQIWLLAVPNILSNLTEPLLSCVDTAFIGHLGKVSYLGAVAMAGTVFSFLFWTFAFLRMGTTGVTAQAFGENNQPKQISVLARALTLSLFFGFSFILLQGGISGVWLSLTHASPEVELYAEQYFAIRIIGSPAVLILFTMNGWFLGLQNSRLPLIITVIENVINIVLNYILIYQCGMNIRGAALGTVCAEYFAVGLCLYFFWKHYRHLGKFFSWADLFNFKEFIHFFNINVDLFIRTLFLVLTFNFFTLQSAQHGDIILASNNLLLLFWMTYAFGIDGIGLAAESLVGKYIGRRDRANLIETIRWLFIWAFGFAAIYMIVYILFGKSLLAIFTNQQEIINTARKYLGWTVVASMVNCIPFIWDGIYTGATATRALRNSMIFSTLFIFVPIYYLTDVILDLGNNAIWLSLVLFMISRGLTLTILFPRTILTKV